MILRVPQVLDWLHGSWRSLALSRTVECFFKTPLDLFNLSHNPGLWVLVFDYLQESLRLFVVALGQGGHSGGEVHIRGQRVFGEFVDEDLLELVGLFHALLASMGYPRDIEDLGQIGAASLVGLVFW